VKRLMVRKQFLAGNKPHGSFSIKLKTILANIGYVQWDPSSILAPSHLISIWNRIGKFNPLDLDSAMWKEKEVLLNWVPVAWIVLTEDFPIFYSLMKRYPYSMAKGWSSHIEPAKKFLQSHNDLKQRVIKRLQEGPAETGEFEAYGSRKKSQDGWSAGNETIQLLFHLQMLGEVMVISRSSNQNVWGLTDYFLPEHVERTVLPQEKLEEQTALRSLKATGVASESDIYRYFVRGRYTDIKGTLTRLIENGKVVKVKIGDLPTAKPHYLLSEDKQELDSIMSGEWEPRLSLIPPFDNLITLRDRTK